MTAPAEDNGGDRYVEPSNLPTPCLVYVHDPMCSWCWGFRPAYDALMADLPDEFNVMRIVGGLAPDSVVPMPEQMQQSLQQTWRTIQDHIPGTEFNFDFWTKCQPRRSTYPACRAVIAARHQGEEWDPIMTRGIQEAYYLHARNPSDNETLVEIAGEVGMAPLKFESDLVSDTTQQALQTEIDFARQMGIQGFPSLALLTESQGWRIQVNHNNPEAMLDEIRRALG